MSDVIKNAVNNYIAKEKKKNDATDGESELDFPSNIGLLAGDVDDALDKLDHDYGILKGKIRKESSLEDEVEDLVEKRTDSIIKSY